VPEYGIRIESTPSSAVPVSEIVQLVIPGAVALPLALQLITAVEFVANEPCAVPDTCRSPAHVALKDPAAEVAVSCDAFHLKLVQDAGEGMMVDDDQLPDRAPMPVAEGPVSLALRRS
jgi:hypothetical protein